ncbi:DUF1007 family protein [Sneathiella marina]|uniref:DUF1007 family protein n=1 Tax=Sneathiella marina TaxID=2950108 RepID=A0ABY4W7E7_9PROT|nr:DUF1007 family protein [Sneathiella marina]USG63111.1 DUF1007 family protein [Sneathiella marina]
MRLLIIICCVIFITPLRPVAAHPHVWTDMTVEVLFDEKGGVTGLRQIWLFDDYYTAYAIEGTDLDGDGKPDPAKLDEIMKVNMEQLREYGYFTDAAFNNEPLKLKPVTEMSTRMRGNRLEMSFVTAFETPVASAAKGFTYAIYDPTYYVEMLHAETDNPVVLTGAPAGCTYRLIPPNPDPSAVAQAAMLDASVRGETGLGAFFAERVSLTCPTE